MKNFEHMPLEKLDISVRTYNCLRRYGISTVGELLAMTQNSLRRVRNLSEENYSEIIEKLNIIGVSLASEDT